MLAQRSSDTRAGTIILSFRHEDTCVFMVHQCVRRAQLQCIGAHGRSDRPRARALGDQFARAFDEPGPDALDRDREHPPSDRLGAAWPWTPLSTALFVCAL